MSRVLLTAISSGSGKTAITCGLLSELSSRGLKVQAYKCGPDYIDPMFHKKVLGIPSENLDLFFSDTSYIKDIINRNSYADISVIEGAMGIYDGIIGEGYKGSAYDLAVRTNTPVILIVDAHGIGNTLVSIIKGILSDDEHKLIKGIIFNRISDNFYLQIKDTVEKETKVKVLGYVGKLKDISIDSRHLGLKLPSEIDEIENQIGIIRKEISDKVDVEAVLAIADSVKEEVVNIIDNENIDEENVDLESINDTDRLRLAVAYDEAFCFYYEDNFRVLRDAKVDLVFFSPIHDEKLPDNISGILIGGGYPELKLRELEENEKMRQSIKSAIDSGIPILAECGGFMYLHDCIEYEDKCYKMVGAVNGKCYNTGKLCRFGYVDLSVSSYKIKGHEFHYFDSTNNGTAGIAEKPGNKKQWQFGHFINNNKIENKNVGLLGFPHLYYGSCKRFIDDFVFAMNDYYESTFGENIDGK